MFAGLIDFETNANGYIPADNEVIALTDIFSIDNINIRFGFDSNMNGIINKEAVFENTGEIGDTNDTAFWVRNASKDTAAPGYETLLGDYFLRQFEPYKPFGQFVILHESNLPVTAASGEIWDIDGGNNTEQFLVQAFNEGQLLESMYSPLGNNRKLDGKPWTFTFNNLSNITKITIDFTGSKRNGLGIAFNNFSAETGVSALTTEVPEPKSVWLFGLVILVYLKLRTAGN